MARKRHGVDYGKCSLDELRHFMAARGIHRHGVAKRNMKREFIKSLERADDVATFPFLDLPPEMRNGIYRELLLFDPKTGYCHPEILATCSQIHDESSDIMYDMNEMSISYSYAFRRSTDEVEQKATYGGPLVPDQMKWFAGIEKGVMNWPRPLLSFHRLRINITIARGYMTRPADSSTSSTISNTLATLVSFLQESTKLKRVTISGRVLAVGAMHIHAKIAQWLYPLSRLCANFDCHLEGFHPYEKILDTLQKEARVHQDFYSTHFLRKWALIEDERAGLQALGCQLTPTWVGIGTKDQALEQELRSVRAELIANRDLPFTKIQDEKKAMDCVDRAAKLFNRFFEEEALPLLDCDEGELDGWHWGQLERFIEGHTQRIEEYPE